MAKGILIVKVPKSCKKCTFCIKTDKYLNTEACVAANKNTSSTIYKKQRPKWCPIKTRRKHK